jgi:Uma2 family endonuclease
MTTAAHQLLTAYEYWSLPENGMQRALVRGEVYETMPPGGRHGLLAAMLSTLLRLWARTGQHGCVGVESGFLLMRNPDTVRGPDVFFIRAERIPSTGIPEGFWLIHPDLAVEVVSPTETAEDVREKVRDSLAAGTPLVWVIYPRTQEVVAHTADGFARTYSHNDTLDAPTLLPGFTCAVNTLFEDLT